jgi:hypothetical protein
MYASKLKQLIYTINAHKISKLYAVKLYLTIESFIQLLFLIIGDITLIQLRQTTPNPARSFIDFNSFIEVSKTWASFKNGLVKFTLENIKLRQQYDKL